MSEKEKGRPLPVRTKLEVESPTLGQITPEEKEKEKEPGVPPAVPQEDEDWRRLTLGEVSDALREECYDDDVDAINMRPLFQALSAAGATDVVVTFLMAPGPAGPDMEETHLPRYHRLSHTAVHGSTVTLFGLLAMAKRKAEAMSRGPCNPFEGLADIFGTGE